MSYSTDSSQQKILTFNTLCKNVISDKFYKKIYTCHTSNAKTYLLHNKITHFYNPQIQIFAESETKRPFFECSFKTKRTKKGLAHNTNNKARNKSQNHSISGFVKHNSTGNIIAFK